MTEHSNMHVCGESDHIMLVQPIRYAGYIGITDNFSIAAKRKPCWFHRLMVRLLLGWTWEDA